MADLHDDPTLDPFHPKNAPVREPDNHNLDNLIISQPPSNHTQDIPPPLKSAEQENVEKYQPPEGRWEPDVLRPRHREILRRVLEGSTYQDIADAMGIHKQTVMLVATSKLFRSELAKLEERLDFNIVQRADSMANEALDKIKTLMRSARSEFLQKACAERILDTAGYSKVERKIVGIVTGEDVIRELNKRKRESAPSNIEGTTTSPDDLDNRSSLSTGLDC